MECEVAGDVQQSASIRDLENHLKVNFERKHEGTFGQVHFFLGKANYPTANVKKYSGTLSSNNFFFKFGDRREGSQISECIYINEFLGKMYKNNFN